MDQQPPTLRDVLDLLEAESLKRRENLKLSRLGSLALAVTLLGMIVVFWVVRGSFPTDVLTDFAPFWLIVLGGVALTAKHRKALHLAAALEDERVVGHLIEALGYGDRDVAKLAQEALSRRPQPSRLTEDQTERLARSLIWSTNPAFTLWTLSALHSQGNREAIPWLEAFIESPPFRRSRSEFVRQKEYAKIVLADTRLRAAATLIKNEKRDSDERYLQSMQRVPLEVVLPEQARLDQGN